MADPIIDDIKQKLDIVDIIGHYITLKKSGTTYKGLCPFHGEKTPSFTVNRERQLYRCFGCGESGDVFAFVMKQENIDFASALKLLAGQAGVTLPERTTRGGSGEDKSTLFAVNELAAKFFHQILTKHPAGKDALAYIKKRGVSDESIAKFMIGYAPVNNSALRALLDKQGYTLAQIKAAGSPDRYRGRIMFPFRDVIGRVVGFSGRAMGDEQPKYLNTAETDLFKKNRFIYGLYEAKKSIAAEQKILLVEGQLDLVLSHQVGTSYAVATSGTALTDEHLTALRRYNDKLYLAFDGDNAGRKATDRGIQMALKHAFELHVVPMPEGSDPGDLTIKDPKLWQELLAKPQEVIEWLFHYHMPNAGQKLSIEERKKVFDALFPYIALQDDLVSRSYYLQHLALQLGLQQEKVIHDAYAEWLASDKTEKNPPKPSGVAVAEGVPSPKSAESKSPTPTKPEEDEERKRERSLIGMLLISPTLLEYKEFHLEQEDFVHEALAKLYTSIYSWYNESTNKSSSQSLISHVEKTLADSGRKALQSVLFDTQSAIADLTPEQLLHEYAHLVQTIRQRQRENRIQSFATRIAQAEAANDRSQVLALMAQMQTSLKKEFHAEKNP